MQFKPDRSRAAGWLSGMLALVMALCAPPPGSAATALDKQLAQARATTISAVVIATPGSLLTPVFVTERYLAKTACIYSVNDPNELARLFDVLEHAHIRVLARPARRLDLRSIVLLADHRGNTTKLLFEGFGEYVHGSVDGVAVVANFDLPYALGSWAGAQVPLSAPAYTVCQR